MSLQKSIVCNGCLFLERLWVKCKQLLRNCVVNFYIIFFFKKGLVSTNLFLNKINLNLKQKKRFWNIFQKRDCKKEKS